MRKIAAAIAIGVVAGLFQTALAAETPIVGVRNAEDLIPLPGGRWVLASSITGGTKHTGEIYAIDAQNGRSTKLYPTASPAPHGNFPGCPTEVAATAFAPHGLAFSPDTQGGALYVVNHGGRESIEMFRVSFAVKTGAAPTLKWTGCLISPPGVMQNSVAADKTGTIFVTASPMPPGDRKPSDVPVGYVASWDQANGWKKVPKSEVPGANGILVAPDGKRLFVNAWLSQEVLELTPGAGDSARRAIKLDFRPDNLRWADDGAILIAGQKAEMTEVMTCYLSSADSCAIASAVAVVDPQSFTVGCKRMLTPVFATVLAPVGKDFWVGSARSDKILRYSGDALSPPQCK